MSQFGARRMVLDDEMAFKESEVPLYYSDKEGEEMLMHKWAAKSQWRSVVLKHSIIHLALLAVYTTILFSWWSRGQSNPLEDGTSRTYSPANVAVKWELKEFENSLETDNPYKGPPSPEYEQAWNKLLHPQAVRVSADDLKRINRSSIPIADGSGYMVTLDAHHQLHCLRWVRQMLHKEHYNMSYEKEQNLGQHVDHCLDALRQFVMCKADVVMITYDWMPNFHRPWPNFEVRHECVNWDSIQTWATENSFNGWDPDLIKHPNFHPELGSPFSYGVSGNTLD